MSIHRHSETAFETVIESHLAPRMGTFLLPETASTASERSFPETVLAFIRETQPKEWAKLELLARR